MAAGAAIDRAADAPPARGAAGADPAVAELRRAKQAAEAANEAKTRYLVAVSHELRSPLNAIYGYAQLLERGGDVAPAEAGAVIRRSAEHLANLVEGVLEISRIESGVVTVRSDLVDVRALIADVVEMFRAQAAAKGLALTLDLAEQLPRHARSDEKRLRQILINLLSNAVKYTDRGGIAVTVRYRTHVADVEVADTGPGIPPADLERVFQPFERGAGPAARREPGLGLGLAITRLLAQVMGGDVSVASTPGAGSRFRLRLMLAPAGAAPTGAVGPRRITGYAGPRRAVLAVDDDPAHLAMVGALLRPLGFAVRTAGDAVAALALAAEAPVDLALLDIQLPGADGWAVAAGLRRACGPDLPIMMLSANAHEAAGQGDGFLVKPVALDALLAAIGRRLHLRWTEEDRAGPEDATPVAGMAPPAAEPVVARLHRLARIGHLKGVEEAVVELERGGPEAAGLAARLRRRLGELDLPGIVAVLDDARGPPA